MRFYATYLEHTERKERHGTLFILKTQNTWSDDIEWNADIGLLTVDKI